MTRRTLALLVLLVFLVPAGCGTITRQDALIISGETLVASDKQFRRVAAGYVEGCDKAVPRQIPATECSAFKDFGQRWIKSWPLVADLWLAAKDAGDKATLEGVTAAVTGLVAELGKFTLKLIALVSGQPAGGK